MNLIALILTAFAALYGLVTILQKKTPLFYKIVVFGFWCYLLATAYRVLYASVIGTNDFHAGYLGYAGTFFFLLSSYYGALDRLADGGEPEYRGRRLAALLPPLVIIAWGVWYVCAGEALLLQLLLIPVAAASYFACKHLILPDVDMGIIQVMRLYNGVILILCLLQPMAVNHMMDEGLSAAPMAISSVLAALVVPLAHRGCRKWFM